MQNEFRADLHCHSNCSDGTDSPEELLSLAKASKLQGLSITDHDTIQAYTPKLFTLAKELEIALLPGVEISSEFEGGSVHILGYGFDLKSRLLTDLLLLLQKARIERNRSILEKLRLRKMAISEEELKEFASNRIIGRPHIAKLMVQKGYVSSLKEAFELYLKEGALCYCSGMKCPPHRVIETIGKAGGKAILAHPHFYRKGAWLSRLLEEPFDGYECHYSRLDKSVEKSWVDMAEKKGLLATGGSDYHGSFKPFISLGVSWVNREVFEQLGESNDTDSKYRVK